MKFISVPFDQIPQFSDRDKAYVSEHPKLHPFYKYPVQTDAFEEVIRDKSQEPTDRDLLVKVLEEQYHGFTTSPEVTANIERLADSRTFTLVTAHQPSLFTGPLYFIYKICSVINLSRQLNDRYPDYNFVPVFVIGGEDHDFEEINHLHLFGKTVTWQNDEQGPVGRMSTATLVPVLEEIKDILGDSPQATALYDRLKDNYSNASHYGRATFSFVNDLFNRTGLVVLSMDHAELKRRFIPVMEKELMERPSKGFVEAATQQLEEAGFSGQAFPREINLFYLKDQLRERIVWEENSFRVLNTDLTFSPEEMKHELHQHPQRFSPNVVIRPLYQEYILPNLAYIGGGGEIAYWLERKAQFEHFGINFPMLIRRNSVLWIDKGNAKRMNKLDLSLSDLLGDTEALIKDFVKEESDNQLSLKEEKRQLAQLFQGVINRVKAVDPTLVATVKAEIAKQQKSLDQMEGKLIRAEKQKHEIAINQIRNLKDRLFPNNGLQERYDNFMAFYLKHGEAYFNILLEHLDPMKKELLVVIED